MVAQCQMFVAAGAEVRVVGHGDAIAFPFAHPKVAVTAIGGAGRARTVRSSRSGRLIGAAGRFCATAWRLGGVLRRAMNGADMVLAAVPPVVPAVAMAVAMARRRGIPVAIDWHNLSASMAALSVGRRHLVVRGLSAVESWIGRRATLQFAVTAAMADHLHARFDREILVLPDRPAHQPTDPPREVSAVAIDDLIRQLGGEGLDPERPPDRRWHLAVSPTSWGLDEDMEMLIDALAELEMQDGHGLAVIVTGKGPRRAAFERRVSMLRRPGLRVATGWLAEDDYERMLHLASVGICLHISSSKLDFPMKIVDMEAAGMPLLAFDYGPVLRQGVAHLARVGLFTDSAGLRRHLRALPTLPAEPPPRVLSPEGPCAEIWPDVWNRVARPALLEHLAQKGN